MSAPNSHRAKAEEAVIRTKLNDSPEPGAFDQYAKIIAATTYPTELIGATLDLLRLVEGEARIRDRHGEEFAVYESQQARHALDLYENRGGRP